MNTSPKREGTNLKKIKTERPPNPARRDKIIALKLNAEEWAAIETKAKKFADGNVSAFVRFAALNFKK